MRNLNWTAVAVTVMLLNVDNALGQATTVAGEVVRGGAAPPAGQANVRCTGTYSVPAGQVADHVNVEIYEKSVQGGQVVLTLVATVNNAQALAGGNYTTAQTTLNKGIEHVLIAYLYTTPAAGGAPSKVNPGVTSTFKP
jgi:hypothetical protein